MHKKYIEELFFVILVFLSADAQKKIWRKTIYRKDCISLYRRTKKRYIEEPFLALASIVFPSTDAKKKTSHYVSHHRFPLPLQTHKKWSWSERASYRHEEELSAIQWWRRWSSPHLRQPPPPPRRRRQQPASVARLQILQACHRVCTAILQLKAHFKCDDDELFFFLYWISNIYSDQTRLTLCKQISWLMFEP